MQQVRFKEPTWIWMIFVASFGMFWPFMWGVVPFIGGDEVPGFMKVLFPAIGVFGAVIGWGLASRLRGAGFRLTSMGIEGAADSEGATVGWAQVRGLGFQMDPTMRVNGVPVKRLVAHLQDGTVLRVSTLGVPKTAEWEVQLEEARSLGIVPSHVRIEGSPTMDDWGRAAAELHQLAEAGVDPRDVLAAAAQIRRDRLAGRSDRGWVEDVIDEPGQDGPATSWPSA